jgi:hypothetical protein
VSEVAVEAVAVVVVATGGPVPGGVLDVAARRPHIESVTNPFVQCVRVKLGEADLRVEALDQLAGVLASESLAASEQTLSSAGLEAIEIHDPSCSRARRRGARKPVPAG